MNFHSPVPLLLKILLKFDYNLNHHETVYCVRKTTQNRKYSCQVHQKTRDPKEKTRKPEIRDRRTLKRCWRKSNGSSWKCPWKPFLSRKSSFWRENDRWKRRKRWNKANLAQQRSEQQQHKNGRNNEYFWNKNLRTTAKELFRRFNFRRKARTIQKWRFSRKFIPRNRLRFMSRIRQFQQFSTIGRSHSPHQHV